MNQKTRVVTQLPGKLTTRGRGACQESCAHRSDIKSQLNTLDLPLNHKSEGEKKGTDSIRQWRRRGEEKKMPFTFCVLAETGR